MEKLPESEVEAHQCVIIIRWIYYYCDDVYVCVRGLWFPPASILLKVKPLCFHMRENAELTLSLTSAPDMKRCQRRCQVSFVLSAHAPATWGPVIHAAWLLPGRRRGSSPSGGGSWVPECTWSPAVPRCPRWPETAAVWWSKAKVSQPTGLCRKTYKVLACMWVAASCTVVHWLARRLEVQIPVRLGSFSVEFLWTCSSKTCRFGVLLTGDSESSNIYSYIVIQLMFSQIFMGSN